LQQQHYIGNHQALVSKASTPKEGEASAESVEVPKAKLSKRAKNEGLIHAFLSNQPDEAQEWVEAGANLKTAKIGNLSLFFIMLSGNQPEWRSFLMSQPDDLWNVTWNELLQACRKWAWEDFKIIDEKLNLSHDVWFHPNLTTRAVLSRSWSESYLFHSWSNTEWAAQAFEEKIRPILEKSGLCNTKTKEALKSTYGWNFALKLDHENLQVLANVAQQMQIKIKPYEPMSWEMFTRLDFKVPLFREVLDEELKRVNRLDVSYQAFGSYNEAMGGILKNWSRFESKPIAKALKLSKDLMNIDPFEGLMVEWILKEEFWFDSRQSQWRGLDLSKGGQERLRLIQWVQSQKNGFSAHHCAFWFDWLGTQMPAQTRNISMFNYKLTDLDAFFEFKGSILEDVLKYIKAPNGSWDRISQVEVKELLKQSWLHESITVDKVGVDFLTALKQHQPKVISEYERKYLNKALSKPATSSGVSRKRL